MNTKLTLHVACLPVKDGQKSLEELDRYRYDEAPKVFADKKTKHGVDIDSIKLLVEWKL